MAQISFSDAQHYQSNTSNTLVGFFSLKDDNDEAVVRFMHDSPESFDMAVVHNVNIGGKYRNVNCLRNPNDPIEKCPLCASNVKLQTKIFVHLIEYVRSDNGQIVPTPKIWERPSSFANELYSKIMEYGPLSEHLFKVHRSGARGDMKTSYSVNYCIPTTYPESVYPKVPNAFDGFSILNFHVMDKTAEDMNVFLSQGNFPVNKQGGGNPSGTQSQPAFVQNATPQPTNVQPPRNFNNDQQFASTTAPQQFTPPTPQQPYQPPVTKPWEVPISQQSQERPARYY